MSELELKRLAHSEYWDERYANVGPDEQVHEWFRSFDDLVPMFERHLFQVRGPETAPKILHLGSGDSVKFSTSELWSRNKPNSCADNTSGPLKEGLQEPTLC